MSSVLDYVYDVWVQNPKVTLEMEKIMALPQIVFLSDI